MINLVGTLRNGSPVFMAYLLLYIAPPAGAKAKIVPKIMLKKLPTTYDTNNRGYYR